MKKKSFLFLSALLVFLLSISTEVFGADSGSCVEVSPGGFNNLTLTDDNPSKYRLTVLCTADATGALSATLSTDIMTKITGMWAYAIVSYQGDITETPDDATDLEITTSIGLTLLDSNGTDFIDATSTQLTFFRNLFTSTAYYPLTDVKRPWVFSTTGNNNALSQFYLDIYFSY